MTDLHALFKARGMTMQALTEALDLGIEMHSIQKVISGERSTKYIQEAIAAYLGLTVEQTFGPRAEKHIRPLIECEINRKRAEYEHRLKKKFLDKTVANRRRAVNG